MVNKVILIGNVGGDPEIRTLENGNKMARLRLATTERIFDRQSNTTKEHTEWHSVILWRGLADVVDRFVHKGSQIYIEGRLRTRDWTDNATNTKRSVTEIVADTMNLLGRRDNYNNHNNGGGYGQNNRPNDNTQPNHYNGSGGGYGQGAANGGDNSPKVDPPADDPDNLPF